MQFFITDEAGDAHKTDFAEYDRWHSTLPDDQRISLGKLLAKDTIGDTTVFTIFIGIALGLFGRRPQLWTTFSAGPDSLRIQLYSSSRASMSGHARTCRELRKEKADAKENPDIRILA